MYQNIQTFIVVAQWPGSVHVMAQIAGDAEDAEARALLRLMRSGRAMPDKIEAYNSDALSEDAGVSIDAVAN